MTDTTDLIERLRERGGDLHMTHDELEAIRARDAMAGQENTHHCLSVPQQDRRALLAEVDRLRDWQRRVVQAWDHAESGGFTHAMLALIEEAGRE